MRSFFNRQITLLLMSLCIPFIALATDYKASMFGIKSNGTTLNTKAIQKAIDYISDHGGGRLIFYVGRYLTGSIQLKSNVSIKLEEGAILVGSTSIYDYMVEGKPKALIWANKQDRLGISGKGVIEGNGAMLIQNIQEQQQKNFVTNPSYPPLIDLNACSNVQMDSVQLWKAAGAVQVYTHCRNVQLNQLTIKSAENNQNKGIVLANCLNVYIQHLYVETSGQSIMNGGGNRNIIIEDSVEANGKLLDSRLALE